MSSFFWLLPAISLVLYGALLNILALRRRWSPVARWYVVYLIVALGNAFALTLSFGQWTDPTLTHLVRDATLYSEVILALFFFPLTRIFLQLAPRPRLVIGGILAAILLAIFDQFDLAVDTPLGSIPYDTIALALGLGLALIAYGLVAWNTYQQYRRLDSPLHRNRLLYLAIAVGLQVVATLINITFPPPAPALATLARILGTLILAYAILRHQLADLYFLMRQGINYILLTALTIGIYVVSFQLSSLLFANAGSFEPLITVLAAAIALALVYQPLHDIMQRVLDAALFGRRFNHERIIQEYSQQMSALGDIETFADDALKLLKEGLGVRDGILLLAAADETGYQLHRPPDGLYFHLAADNPIVREFANHRRYLLQYDIDLAPQYRAMDTATHEQLKSLRAEVWVPIFIQEQFGGVWAVGPKISGERYSEKELGLLSTLADQTAVALANMRLEESRQAVTREKEQVREMFQHYVAPSVVKHLMGDQSRITLGGERQVVTILFADIQGFTSLAEKLPAHELVNVLNGYLTLAASIILKYEGTLDKFMGDGVMALFNAPLPQADHAARAAKAAMAIQDGVYAYASSLPDRLRLVFRIGIHTGEAVVGNIGTADLMNYTAIGDTVNIAKRLQENARAGQVLISQETLAGAMNVVKARPFTNLVVKGRVQPVVTFEITVL
ncbi:MAG: adenylate/guanylate cyclase domain-containing protein [Anaerolineae bacterium]